MGTIDTLLRIKADASNAVRGLRPLQTSLEEVAVDAHNADKALDGLDGVHKIILNDEAIESARQEVTRLKDLMREQLRIDPTANTTEAQRRIRQLQSSIRVLDAQHPRVDVTVDVSGTGNLQNAMLAVEDGLGNVLPGVAALSGGLKGIGVAAGPAAAGVAAVGTAIGAWKLGELAADVETTKLTLSTLTGSVEDGARAFEMLQEFAKDAPFALDSVTTAAKNLLIAGVDLEDIPDWLTDIGNAASAAEKDIGEVAVIFQQMLTKGKASNEELLQLTERAIPAYDILADTLGLSVAEVQKLAEKGQLGRDAVEAIAEGLGRKFPNAMADQAESFNGKMSTLNDTLVEVGATLGEQFLPAMKDTVDVLQDAADVALFASENIGTAGNFIKDMIPFADQWGWAIQQGWENAGDAIGFLADQTRDADDELGALGKSGADAGDEAAGGIDLAANAVADLEQQIKEANEELANTLDAFAEIGQGVRTRVDFIISAAELQEEIEAAIAGTPGTDKVDGVPAVGLPANLNIKQLAGLGDKQQELVGTISSFVEQGLSEGARRAEVVPGFDEDKWLKQVREDTAGLLVDAGVDTKALNRVLENIFGLPREVPIEADISAAQDALNQLTDPLSVPIIPMLPNGPSQRFLEFIGSVPTTGTPTRPTAPAGRPPERLSPKQTPVVVHNYIDGAELKAHMETVVVSPGRGRRRMP